MERIRWCQTRRSSSSTHEVIVNTESYRGYLIGECGIDHPELTAVQLAVSLHELGQGRDCFDHDVAMRAGKLPVGQTGDHARAAAQFDNRKISRAKKRCSSSRSSTSCRPNQRVDLWAVATCGQSTLNFKLFDPDAVSGQLHQLADRTVIDHEPRAIPPGNRARIVAIPSRGAFRVTFSSRHPIAIKRCNWCESEPSMNKPSFDVWLS